MGKDSDNSDVTTTARPWRTRQDPFAEDWDQISEMLVLMPDLQGTELFGYLQEQYPGRYADGLLRTLQRRLQLWRALNGTEKETYFEQVHSPGRMIQLDWTHCDRLNVVVDGKDFPHRLCHCVLTFSNWEWASICFSEDFLSLKNTLQETLFELGGVPRILQIDRTSAATFQLRKGEPPRDFTPALKSLMTHFKFDQPQMINTGKPNENGNVESMHGHFRRRIEQALMLRGSRRFDSQADYASFVERQLHRANANRQAKLKEECRHLRALPPTRYPEFEESMHKVGITGTVWVKKKAYSAPSRLIGRSLHSRIHLDHIELFLHNQMVHSMKRVYGDESGIAWQHMVQGLVRKPGAFARYRYRDQMFPSALYQQLCNKLRQALGEYSGDREYLHILSSCATLSTKQADTALKQQLADAVPLTLEGFRTAAGLSRPFTEVLALQPDLSSYDFYLQPHNEEICHE